MRRIYDCNNSCISDYDSDGVCDINEIYGCMEEGAYNYSPIATENQGCLYPGCMDELACNYDMTANEDDGSCIFDEFCCQGFTPECLSCQACLTPEQWCADYAAYGSQRE